MRSTDLSGRCFIISTQSPCNMVFKGNCSCSVSLTAAAERAIIMVSPVVKRCVLVKLLQLLHDNARRCRLLPVFRGGFGPGRAPAGPIFPAPRAGVKPGPCQFRT